LPGRTTLGVERLQGDFLDALWYEGHPLSLVLAPLGWLYAAVVRLRRTAYRTGLLRSHRIGVPVVVVGNVSVGGTGKTPLVIGLARFLAARGWRPGIVCRGYGGRARTWPRVVVPDSDPAEVGDEAVLLAQRTGLPVLACGPERVRAARRLAQDGGCDLVISDDGLQHLALARDVEVAVVDGERRHGNGRCLPAGPLREPASRLDAVDMVVSTGAARHGEFAMRLEAGAALALEDAGRQRQLQSFTGTRVHAVCGIGNPQRFFSMLSDAGLVVVRHPLPDHHAFVSGDLEFGDGAPVLMTEKDAVKCRAFARPGHWYVPVTAVLPGAFCERVEGLLAATGGQRRAQALP
jgi:tetraacyldisaccharide 4'-kinase